MLIRSPIGALVLAALCVGFAPSLPDVAVAGPNFDGPLQGDVTCDDSVDVADGLDVLRGVALIEPFADCLSRGGDVNCDLLIDAADAIGLFRFAAGMTVSDGDPLCSEIGATRVRPPLSEQLIADALEAEEITYEESLLYRAYAMYGHPDLPEAFRSPIPDMHAGIELFLEIETHRGELSQGLLDQLAPFTARPADPISIFNNPLGGVSAAAPVAWKSEPAGGGMARVWVIDGPNATTQLATYAAAVTKVWNALPGVFRYGIPDTPGAANINPDGAIDIYFAPTGTLDPREGRCARVPAPADCAFSGNGVTGYANLISGNSWASYAIVNTTRTGDGLLNTIAHELGHVGQHAYDVSEPLWLKDSTATWIAFRVIQKIAGANHTYTYDRLPDFFSTLDDTLTRDPANDLHRYGSWLYFYFLSMDLGDSVVTNVWQNAARQSQQNAEAVDEAALFEDYFDNFTVRNWNREYVEPRYWGPAPSEPTFPTLEPDAPPQTMNGEAVEVVTFTQTPLSAKYFHYKFGPNTRHVTFDNLLLDEPDAHVHAILKIDGEWEKPDEDWTGLAYRRYCIDLPDEKLEEVVLVFSNSDMVAPLPNRERMQISTSTLGCEGYKGWAQAIIHQVSDDVDLTYDSGRVDLHFEPQDDQADPLNVEHDLVEGSLVHWEASGTQFGCTVNGTNSALFVGGEYDPVNPTNSGYLNVVGPTDIHSILVLALDPTGTMTVTCPTDTGPTITEAPHYGNHLLVIVSEQNTHDGDKTILEGDQTIVIGNVSYHYQWHLEPLPGDTGGP